MQYFFAAYTFAQHLQNIADPNSHATDTRLPAALERIMSNSALSLLSGLKVE